MKKFLHSFNLNKDHVALIYALLAAILLAVPERVASVLPQIIGVVMLAYALINLLMVIFINTSETEIGDSVLSGAVGLVVFLQGESAIVTIGVIWAVLSLSETAEEMNGTFRDKSYNAANMAGYLVTIVLAVLLMFDPFEHFHMHIRILGAEMLFSVLMRRLRLFRTK